MHIKLQGFMGQKHSWAVCHWGIARSLKKMGHTVDLFATDGLEYLPPDLRENIIGYTELNSPKIIGTYPTKSYDAQISYTAMKNWEHLLSSGDRNRIALWCYEWKGKNVLPTGWAKNYKYCDFIAAPSNFTKQSFIDSGIPESAIKVISHGVDDAYLTNVDITPLPTKKGVKILVVLAQNHLRKNIPGLLEAYGKAFTDKDDVSLILKAKEKPVQQPFDVSLKECLANFYRKYPRHAEVILYSDFLSDMSALYRSVDIVYGLAHCEGFYFPALEGLLSGKVNIAPKWGGQLDFLDSSNALLVEGKEARANPRSIYWQSRENAICYMPSIDDAVEKLRYAYHNHQQLNRRIEPQLPALRIKYSWNTVVSQMLSYCK
jgi:O-antigen biosynthesis alpha-1,2-mannosyltransferase